MNRLTILGLIGVLVVGLTATGWWFVSSQDTTAEAIASTQTETSQTETAIVTRRTLRQTEEFEASVGYGDTFTLPGTAQGTVTWVAEKGTILEPGDMLYRVDERPTYWTQGEIPMYRTLERRDKGTDVEQLQRFLHAGGYLDDDYEIDAEFDSSLRAAVKAWQDDHGLDDTGRIDAAQLLFLPYDALRVATTPRVGDQANGGVLEVTSPDLFVSADVSTRKKRAFEGDPTIEVELADGSRYAATVVSIESVESQDPYGEQQFRIRLELDAPAGQQPGDVNVEVIDVLAVNVLTVPVSALVALVEGGYAVEALQPDGNREYRSIEIGEFADGWVEITGDITDGDQIVVPK